MNDWIGKSYDIFFGERRRIAVTNLLTTAFRLSKSNELFIEKQIYPYYTLFFVRKRGKSFAMIVVYLQNKTTVFQ